MKKLSIHLEQISPVALDVAMEVADGEIVALVGPSGAGKTTILKSLCGLMRPTKGFIQYGDQCWYDSQNGIDLSPQARRIGMVFQSYMLFPHMTALQNVAASLEDLPLNARKDEAKRLLAVVGLEGLENRRPKSLSGGQCQRVAFARALARRPNVLLLDEPFSAVDQVTRQRLQRNLVRLREQLTCPTLLVTHDLEEAGHLADRMVVLSQGKTLQSGSPNEVVSKPNSVLVARLVNQPNIFSGALLVDDEQDEANTTVKIRWGRILLETNMAYSGNDGDRVHFVVPSQYVVLHGLRKNSRGERENPVHGTIREVVTFTDIAIIKMEPAGQPSELITFQVASHTVRRMSLIEGSSICVSLLAEGIHILSEAD